MQQIDMDSSAGARLSEYVSVIGVGIQFAFQPVVSLKTSAIQGFEALVRGRSGEPASTIIANVLPENLVFFDQACRTRAIQDAAELAIEQDLYLNCTEVDPSNLDLALAATRDAVDKLGLRRDQIVLEFTSLPRLGDPRQLSSVRDRARHCGFRVLADNFGTGEAGLKRLAVFAPDLVKLDRELINRVHTSRRRQAMVLGVAATCRALDMKLIATGVEQAEEVQWLHEVAGIELFQGYYFARPALNEKTTVDAALLTR